MEHPLPPGIFVEMKPSPDEFDEWTEEDFDNEIERLKKRVKELKKLKKPKTLASIDEDDDIMDDPDVHEMVENGEHTCHMFDAPCQACEEDED